jgi:hypothetical protein
MTNDEKQLLRKVAIFVGLKVALYMAIHYASKRLRKITISEELPPSDTLLAYAKKDIEFMEHMHRGLVIDESGKVIGGFSRF